MKTAEEITKEIQKVKSERATYKTDMKKNLEKNDTIGIRINKDLINICDGQLEALNWVLKNN